MNQSLIVTLSEAKRLLSMRWQDVAWLVVLQFVVLTYLFTYPVFTDHTFPNSFLYPYPSFKTLGEGRWMADLLILLQGGSGVQPLQMFLAALLQAVNGLLVAKMFGANRPIERALVAVSVCLCPLFIDYYSSIIDHLGFAIGDTFAIVAVALYLRRPFDPYSWALGAVGVALSLGCYQPKIAFIGLLTASAILMRLDAERQSAADSQMRTGLTEVLVPVAMMAAGCALYYLVHHISHAPVDDAAGPRADMNSWAQALAQANAAYTGGLGRLYKALSFIPWPFRIPGLLAILLAGLAIAISQIRRSPWTCLASILTILAVPFVLNAAMVLNISTPAGAGRIDFAYAYLMLFAASWLCGRPWGRHLGMTVLTISSYFGLIAMSQISNAAVHKSSYEVARLTRVLVDAERHLDPGRREPRALVVIGRGPDFPNWDYIRNQQPGLQLSYDVFPWYRQVLVLNHLVGWRGFRDPTPTEVSLAIESSQSRPVWPAPDSVYRLEGTVIIKLEDFGPDTPVTRARD